MNKFVYIPSFSGGFFGQMLKEDGHIGKIPVRFYDDAAQDIIKHNAFLTTAGHFYKQDDYTNSIGLDLDINKNLVFGDSGGYQIATGAIKWDISIRDRIFNWLENNSNVAINLDIPPRLTWAGKDKECLEISLDNFKYFEKHQSGKTKFMNVLQGNGLDSRKNWYKEVSNFNFNGWALGGTAGKYLDFFNSVYILLKNKEHLNKENYLFHFLGTSTINQFSFYLQLQKSLNEIGSNVIVTCDSSTPQRAVIWGTYYTEFNLKDGRFHNAVFPNIKHQSDVFANMKNFKWPELCEFDKMINENYDWKEYIDNPKEKGNIKFMSAMTLHNFAMFKDAISKVENIVNQDIYFQ
ncbi:MAG: hypothetical protein ACOVNU_05480, partial [Candidatus Kapaibacteriota bacterium]